MRQYGVMIRRLLAIQASIGPVLIDKDKFRWVQYEVADAMLSGLPVTWRWRYLPDDSCTKDAENLEIAIAVARFGSKSSLNNTFRNRPTGYFDTAAPSSIAGSWTSAHARLATARKAGSDVVN
jgi:hypothetical protein